MGILDRLRGRTAATPPADAEFPTAPTVMFGRHFDAVGESNYLEAIEAAALAAQQPEFETVAILHPEPNNPHDRNAVAVHLRTGKVGYLSRADAAQHHREVVAVVRSRKVAAVTAYVTFTRDGGGIGSVVLEPQSAPALSRLRVRATLKHAGITMKGEAQPAGATVGGVEDGVVLVFWSGGNAASREAMLPKLAQALSDADYRADIVRRDGYPMVRVTG